MGTSSLYGGPKKTVLLPSDYTDDGELEGVPASGDQNEADQTNEEVQQEENSVADAPNSEEQDGGSKNEKAEQCDDGDTTKEDDSGNPTSSFTPEVTWQQTRRSFTNAVKNRNDRAVKRLIRNYTKALGGHKNASRQAKSAKKAASGLAFYFSGAPSAIRKRFEGAGIQFDGRPTKDILVDICSLVKPIPDDLDNSLTSRAMDEAIVDIANDESVNLNDLDSFSIGLLQKLLASFMKHYIFDKLTMQSGQGALKSCDNSRIKETEKSIKRYIDGIVDGAVPLIVKPGLNTKEMNKAIDILFDTAYQQMEDLS